MKRLCLLLVAVFVVLIGCAQMLGSIRTTKTLVAQVNARLLLLDPIQGVTVDVTPHVDDNTLTVQQYHVPTWSHDGRYIATYAYESGNSLSKVSVTHPGSRHVTHYDVSAYNGYPAYWSPTDDQILFTHMIDGYPQEHNAAILDIQTGECELLTTVGTVDNPLWSPDGTHISYRIFGVVFAFNTADSELHRVTNSGHNYAVQWSPDGERLSMLKLGGGLDVAGNAITVTSLEDPETENICPGIWANWYAVRSPDWRLLISHDKDFGLFVLDTSTCKVQYSDQSANRVRPVWIAERVFAFANRDWVKVVDLHHNRAWQLSVEGEVKHIAASPKHTRALFTGENLRSNTRPSSCK